MKAQVGDHLIMEGAKVGDRRRAGVIIALHHADGSPPYQVRWLDDDHEGMIFPGPDCRVEPADHPA